MKRCTKRLASRKPEPTPDQVRQYMQALAEEHYQAWHAELTTSAPHWVYLIGLHLRLVELEHLEEAAAEFL
jgi:hypothetical protein